MSWGRRFVGEKATVTEARATDAAEERKDQARAVITTQFMNEWLGKHEDHLISFVRRRHTDRSKDEESGLLLPEAGAPPKVTLSLTCLDCHADVLLAIEDDTGQD
jgi:hypothetical protein